MKFVLGLEYDGSIYHGWQKQKSVLTVQQCVELALSKIADYEVQAVCSGRTDSGVHAIMQIMHFDTCIRRNLSTWFLGMNALLPNDITVLWIKEVSLDFHARFSALSRSYRYLILNQKTRSSFFSKYYFQVRGILNIMKMQYSSQYLIGEHDFTAFKSIGCQSISAVKNIISITIRRINCFIVFDITSTSFLYHMVRNIVGCLLKVGLSQYQERDVKKILIQRDIKKDYPTIPPNGLYFMSSSYPDRYGIIKNYRLNNENSLFAHFFGLFDIK